MVFWWFFLDPKIDLDFKFRHVACLFFLSSKKPCYRKTIKHAKLIFLEFASTIYFMQTIKIKRCAHRKVFEMSNVYNASAILITEIHVLLTSVFLHLQQNDHPFCCNRSASKTSAMGAESKSKQKKEFNFIRPKRLSIFEVAGQSHLIMAKDWIISENHLSYLWSVYQRPRKLQLTRCN